MKRTKAKEDAAAIEKGSVDNGLGAVVEFQENSLGDPMRKIRATTVPLHGVAQCRGELQFDSSFVGCGFSSLSTLV